MYHLFLEVSVVKMPGSNISYLKHQAKLFYSKTANGDLRTKIGKDPMHIDIYSWMSLKMMQTSDSISESILSKTLLNFSW